MGKKIFVLNLICIFLSTVTLYSYDSLKKIETGRDTTNIKNIVEEKLHSLEELIDEEILISEFYNGDYHLILKKAIDFMAQGKKSFERKEFDEALRKVETAQELANRVWNLANKESNELRDRTTNRMQQLDKLVEYSNKLFLNNNFTNVSTKLKELFQQGNKFYKDACSEIDRKEYVSAMESINFGINSILGAMKLSIDELYPEIENIMKENLAGLNDIIKDGIDTVPQSGHRPAEWFFSQSLRYVDMAEKSIREKKFSQAYEMIQLGIGYGNMALRIAKDKVDDSLLNIPNKFQQKKIEETDARLKREQNILMVYESLLKMKDRLSYQNSLIEQVTKEVNGKNDYVLKTRLSRLLDFQQRAEVASLLENYNSLSTFQFLIAKLSYNILELSKTRVAKAGSFAK